MSDLAQWVTVPPPAQARTRDAGPVLPGYPQSAMMRQVHGLWLANRGASEMPTWMSMSALLPTSLLPLTILFTVNREPFDFRYTEIGSRIRAICNADYTGRLMSELPHQRPPSKVWDHLSAAFDARAPVRGALPYVGRSRELSSIYHIVLPLADDGETVDRLLVCVDLGPALRLQDGTPLFTQLGTRPD